MHHRIRTLFALAFVAIAALALSACGSSSSSSGDAKTLLEQTFSGSHPVNSGSLNFSLTLTPTGSSTLTKPIRHQFRWPVPEPGQGQAPEVELQHLAQLGRPTGSLGSLSTGTNGYVTLQGTSYALPAATSRSSSRASRSWPPRPAAAARRTPAALAKLGIHPLQLVEQPVRGRDREHGRGGHHSHPRDGERRRAARGRQHVPAEGVIRSASPARARWLEPVVGHPREDREPGQEPDVRRLDRQGRQDLRKLAIGLNVPVSGQISTQLGGMNSAGVALTMQYGDLNEPQTISTPANVHPYSEFSSKLQSSCRASRGALRRARARAARRAGLRARPQPVRRRRRAPRRRPHRRPGAVPRARPSSATASASSTPRAT